MPTSKLNTVPENVAVSKVKEFEEHFLMEMETKHAEILADFKKGNLSDDNLKKMTELANQLSNQYK